MTSFLSITTEKLKCKNIILRPLLLGISFLKNISFQSALECDDRRRPARVRRPLLFFLNYELHKADKRQTYSCCHHVVSSFSFLHFLFFFYGPLLFCPPVTVGIGEMICYRSTFFFSFLISPFAQRDVITGVNDIRKQLRWLRGAGARGLTSFNLQVLEEKAHAPNQLQLNKSLPLVIKL